MIFLQNDYNLSSNRGTTYKTSILDPIEFGGWPKSLKWSSQSRPMTDLVRKSRPQNPDQPSLVLSLHIRYAMARVVVNICPLEHLEYIL